ncbi:MAG: hypothetical protein CSB01_00560 [Bacteroidia bacterium]|nr:MAG: hypothetical protein CSB01_00560 [Bacteroidia bacterium]
MKKYYLRLNVLIMSMLFFAGNIAAQKQETENEQKIKTQFSGFIKSDLIYDSRQTFEAVDGLYTVYPKDKLLDDNGNDLNAKDNINMLSISSRISLKISAPDVLGAKTTGYLEGDFTARSNSNSIRMRHAYVKLNWKKTEALFGRTWHPLFVEEVFPSVLALNTGVPFQAFNRSPQIRIRYNFTKQLDALFAAIYQNDYCSFGPNGRSAEYIRNAKIPNLHLQLKWKSKLATFGLAGDYKKLMPRTNIKSPQNKTYETSTTIASYALMAYFKIKKSIFEFKTKTMLGQNLSEHLLTGGYAVSEIDNKGYEKYTPSNNFYFWSNLAVGKQLKGRLFFGFTKNLGFSDNVAGYIYARGANIDKIIRLAPSVEYQIKKLRFFLEFESTSAHYGDIEYRNSGKVNNTHKITNKRVQFTTFLFF